jgi:predicted GNAT family N-acyltransferase
MENLSTFVSHRRDTSWGGDILLIRNDGTSTGRLYWFNDDTYTSYIEGIHVSENSRMNGLGNEVLHELLLISSSLGFTKCMLWCSNNSFVKSWYERNGFVYSCDYDDEDDSIWMMATLQ